MNLFFNAGAAVAAAGVEPLMDANFPMELLKLGGTGGLAIFMFYFYRQDRKASEETIKGLANDFKDCLKTVVESIEKLTEERVRKN